MIQTHTPLTLEMLEDHMVFVEGGEFMMGGESGHEDSKPSYPVHLDNFCLCRYPVTQTLWKAVMDTDPEELAFPHPQRPVERVSWYDAVDFCNRLSDQMGYQRVYTIDRDRPDPNNQNDSDKLKWIVSRIEGANGFHLPTEAEWEYAARGGRYAQSYEYAGSPNPNEVAWWDRTSQDFTQPVGLRIPNALGLFDMTGNVREWVWDWFGSNYYETCAQQGMAPNPSGPTQGEFRGVRGGSWYLSYDDDLRVAFRLTYNPVVRDFNVGFRVSRYL